MFVKLTTLADLPQPNEAKEFRCGDKEICVANVNGEFSAMENICLHRGGPLGQGTIENGKVICPWHGGSGIQRPDKPRITRTRRLQCIR